MPVTNELRTLMKKERQLRNVMESMKEFIQNYQEDRDKGAVDARIKKLDQVYDSFCAVRMDIECRLEDEEDELTDTDETDEARDQRLAAVVAQREKENVKVFKDFINQYFSLKQSLSAFAPSPSSSARVESNRLSVQQMPAPAMRVKLPELKLPTFQGALMEWTTFRDTFQHLIADNPLLSDIDRFTYLRTSLEGEALQQIASIDLTSANYSIAWKQLESRYENKKLLVKSHLDALFAINPMKKESFEALNHVISEFEKQLQMLSKLGENTATWSTLLSYMLASKLDSTTLRLWETEHRSTEVPKYSAMMEFLCNHRTVLRSIVGVNPTPADTRTPSRSSNTYSAQQQLCPVCDEGQHLAYQCQDFKAMELDERRNAVKSNELCFNCLSRGHTAKFCSRSSCRVCGQRHHSLLHSYSNQSPSDLSSPQSNERPPQNIPNPHEIQTPTTFHQMKQTQNTTQQIANQSNINSHPTATPSMHTPPTIDIPTSHNVVLTASETKTSRSVLLATAIVILEDQFGDTTHARALLDSGSQLCFISETLSQRLNFKQSREALSISGIGQATKRCNQSIFARVRSRISPFTREEVFYVLPQLTLNLPSRRVDINQLNLPNDIVLADPKFNERNNVDIIIGAGLFFDLLYDEKIMLGSEGPVLQNTSLGWVICGNLPSEAEQRVANVCIESLDQPLSKLSDHEECCTKNDLSLEDSTSEIISDRTTNRDSSGCGTAARILELLTFLGLLFTTTKLFVQSLWKQKILWDDPLGEQPRSQWQDFRNNLASLPRWIAVCKDCRSTQFVGFCDTSTKAFRACIYGRRQVGGVLWVGGRSPSKRKHPTSYQRLHVTSSFAKEC